MGWLVPASSSGFAERSEVFAPFSPSAPAAVLALAFPVLTGCSIELEGKPCADEPPRCLAGFVCKSQLCVRSTPGAALVDNDSQVATPISPLCCGVHPTTRLSEPEAEAARVSDAGPAGALGAEPTRRAADAAVERSTRTEGHLLYRDGRCLEVVEGSMSGLAGLHLAECNGRPSQYWSFGVAGELLGVGHQCLAATFADSTLQIPTFMFRCRGTREQQWTLTAAGALLNRSGACLVADEQQPVLSGECSSGAWSLEAAFQVAAGGTLRGPEGQCLGVSEQGTAVELSPCEGSVAQLWSLSSVGTLATLQPGCLELMDGGGLVSNGPCRLTQAQRWRIDSARQVCQASGECLTAAQVASGPSTSTNGTIRFEPTTVPLQVGNIVSAQGFCLEAGPPGAPPRLADCLGTSEQTWRLLSNGEVRGVDDGCLESSLDTVGPLTPISVARCTGEQAQQWRRTPRGELRNRGGHCMEAAGAQIGATAYSHACSGERTQLWRWVEPLTTTQEGQLVAASGHCLGAASVPFSASPGLRRVACDRASNWRLLSNGEIRGQGGLCIDVINGVRRDGTRVQMYPCVGVPAQRWRLTDEGYLRGIGGYCLDAEPSGPSPLQRTCSGGVSQQWSFTRQ